MLKPEQVTDYLKQNPAFLDNHLELILELDNEEASNPFHARQIAVLKQRHATEQARYEEVVESARSNQQLEGSLHGLARELLRSPSSDVVQACHILVEHFSLDGARVVGSADIAESADLASLGERVMHASSICDDRVGKDLLIDLFGESADIASCAFIPMPGAARDDGRNSHDPVLVLGSADSNRFQPGMGAIYLDRIGELIAAFLARGT